MDKQKLLAIHRGLMELRTRNFPSVPMGEIERECYKKLTEAIAFCTLELRVIEIRSKNYILEFTQPEKN